MLAQQLQPASQLKVVWGPKTSKKGGKGRQEHMGGQRQEQGQQQKQLLEMSGNEGSGLESEENEDDEQSQQQFNGGNQPDIYSAGIRQSQQHERGRQPGTTAVGCEQSKLFSPSAGHPSLFSFSGSLQAEPTPGGEVGMLLARNTLRSNHRVRGAEGEEMRIWGKPPRVRVFFIINDAFFQTSSY